MAAPTPPEDCTGVEDKGDAKCLCNHPNLGPKILPSTEAWKFHLAHYKRFGDKTAKEFLRDNYPGGKAEWPNPKHDGFAVDYNGRAIKYFLTLQAGTLIDRFDEERGLHFANFSTPFAHRSLPPSQMFLPYYVYRLKQPVHIFAGPAAPGFEQPGMGTRYIADSKYKSAAEMVRTGVMERVPEARVESLYAAMNSPSANAE